MKTFISWRRAQFRLVVYFICGGIALNLNGCGAKKNSRGNINDPSVTTPVYALMECNRVVSAMPAITGQVGTFYEPGTGRYRTDIINFNITSIPAEIFTSTTISFQFFRWYSRAAGERNINQLPVRMQFMDKLTGMVAPAQPIDRLNKTTIEQGKEALKLTNVELDDFFSRARLLLTGMDLNYDAMAIAYYNTATATLPLATFDVLLPPFYVNPSTYRQLIPITELYNLHPFIGLVNSGAQESDFRVMAEDICRELAGIGTRVPASQHKVPLGLPPLKISEPSLWIKIWNRILQTIF